MKKVLVCETTAVTLELESESWQVCGSVRRPEPQVMEYVYELTCAEASPVPHLRLAWTFPTVDICGRWTPSAYRSRTLPPNWGGPMHTELGISAPVMTLFNQEGVNRETLAFSDAMSPVRMKCGVNEKTALMDCSVEAFWTAGAPVTSYRFTLRLDCRPVRYEAALGAVSSWWASMPAYAPCPVPAEARQPVYSSWYVFHQDLQDTVIEEECALAKPYGMESIIVDDGWQTEDNHGGYAYCGDWEMCLKRFPDMASHVAKVHALGMKYVLWYSMPWVGVKSRNYERFQGRYLYVNRGLGAAALDPRFPEVREFLIGIYETAMREWDLDGFKLDFIDSFRFEGADPAVAEDYAGRDCKSLAEGVDRLLTGTMERLRAMKPEVMIEFRQSYIGPAMRKYGNMFRSGDCPADYVTNRVHTLDIRMLAGSTAVHADMLMWNRDETAAQASRQLTNILFSVPQVSVRLKEIPAEHRAMLSFYLRLWRENSDLLLDGELRAEQPENCFPMVSASKGRRQLTAVYAGRQLVPFEASAGGELIVVNAGGEGWVTLELSGAPVRSVACFDCCGRRVELSAPSAGLSRVAVPDGGVLKLYF